MPLAAVPSYLGNDFSRASPGMRFGMYLKLWGTNNRTGQRLWTTHDINYRVTGKARQEREFPEENKKSALTEAVRLNAADRDSMGALVGRQNVLAQALQLQGRLAFFNARAIAPFTTGLGNEHPLENGFAFLNPYGLPYLPGSGVKGVVRRAAQELAAGEWGDPKGWSYEERYSIEIDKRSLPLSVIDVLFGREPRSGDRDHVRGALSFWDVIPQLEGERLRVEIMTPHQKHYYQDGESPHESGQPNPISFLTVPPGSGFTFHVTCDLARLKRLAPALADGDRWKAPLQAAFEHAFDWLGFGAKTAVGYGAMHRDTQQEAKLREQAWQAEEEARLEQLSPEQRAMEKLRRWLEEDRAAGREEPGGRLANRVAELMREANTWDRDARVALAELAEEIYGYVGWGSGKKKRDRQARIGKLRGDAK